MSMSLHVGNYLVDVSPIGLIVMLLPLAVIATSIAALVRIVQRAGYSGWWILIVLVPGANLLALWYFGFGPWPALPKRSIAELGHHPPQPIARGRDCV
jgi:uncharacterized membrane protein YhaH (DUF805 family)